MSTAVGVVNWGSHPTSVQTSTPTAGRMTEAHTLPQFKPPHLQPGHDDWGSHPTSVQMSTPTAGTWWHGGQFKPPHEVWMTEVTPYLSSYSPGCRCGGLNWGRVWPSVITLPVQTSTPTAGTCGGLNWGRVWAVSHHVPAVGVEVWTEVGCEPVSPHLMMTDGSHPTSVQTSTPRCGGLNWGRVWAVSHHVPAVGVEVWTEVGCEPSVIMSRLLWRFELR